MTGTEPKKNYDFPWKQILLMGAGALGQYLLGPEVLGPAILDTAKKTAEFCRQHPEAIAGAAVTTIVVKEYGHVVADPIKPHAKAALDTAESNIKTTLAASSAICSLALKFAVFGEPISNTVAWVSCPIAGISSVYYLTKDEPGDQ